MKTEVANRLKELLKEHKTLQGFSAILDLEDENKVEDLIKELESSVRPGFNELLKSNKEYQSEYDKQLRKAMETREQKLKSKFNFIKKDKVGESRKEDDDDENDDGSDDESKKDLATKFEELKQIVLGQKANEEKAKKLKKAKELLAESKIPETYHKFFDFESETSLADQVEGIKKDFESIKESIIQDMGGVKFPIPKNGSKGVSDKEIEDIIDNM